MQSRDRLTCGSDLWVDGRNSLGSVINWKRDKEMDRKGRKAGVHEIKKGVGGEAKIMAKLRDRSITSNKSFSHS